PGEREEEEHARDREHDAEQDADRLQHGLEYAGHHDEDEQHREQHVLQHEVLGLFVAVEAFAELPVVTGRQVHGFHEFLDLRLHGFHGRAIREPGVEAHRGSAVVARDARRTAHNLEVRDRGKRDALALLCQQRNVFQVADALLALAAEGKDHVDFTRRRAELAQVVTAHGHGNGTRDFFRRQAEGGGAFAVHRDADLAIAAGGFGAYVRQALDARKHACAVMRQLDQHLAGLAAQLDAYPVLGAALVVAEGRLADDDLGQAFADGVADFRSGLPAALVGIPEQDGRLGAAVVVVAVDRVNLELVLVRVQVGLDLVHGTLDTLQ